MTRLRVRRRWLTPRRVVVLAVIGAVGLVVAVFVGHAGKAAGSASPAEPGVATTVAVCTVEPHSVEGAATAAVEGLHQLALANLTPPQAVPDAVLERYVAPERRPLMRAYLTKYPAPFVAITSTVLAWQAVSYADGAAVLRIATTDVATNAAGEAKTSQAVTSVTVTWDAALQRWMLADWKANAAPNVADVVALGQGVPCA